MSSPDISYCAILKDYLLAVNSASPWAVSSDGVEFIRVRSRIGWRAFAQTTTFPRYLRFARHGRRIKAVPTAAKTKLAQRAAERLRP
jgi:hypothetical protein